MDSYQCVMRALGEEKPREHAALDQFFKLSFESPSSSHAIPRSVLAGDCTCLSAAPAQHSVRRALSVPCWRAGLCRHVSIGRNIPPLQPLTGSDDSASGTA